MLSSITVKSKYKSLAPFAWENLPKFAVITGINGVGKSQFLQALYDEIARKTHYDSNHRTNLGASILDFKSDGEETTFQKTLYMRSDWQPGNFNNVSRGSIDGTVTNFINWVFGKHKPNPTPESYKRLKASIESQTSKSIASLSENEILSRVPFDFIEQDERVVLNNHLSDIFVGYVSKHKQFLHEISIKNGSVTVEDIGAINKELGVAPWDKINASFEKNGFNYRVNSPENDTIPFQCKFTDKNNQNKLDFADLSSGEKMIVTLILWSYNQEIGALNNLFLLDEPDAHLHPSMCKLFLKIVSETLVDEYGIQVILTTHNPSTVALSPESSLYIMSKDGVERIRKATKIESIAQLTENLLSVTPSFRIVLVEDKNDYIFFETIYNELIVLEHISNNPPLVFKPASTQKNSGGFTVVKAWVEKFNETKSQDSNLKEFLHGIIDRDEKNIAENNVHVTARYSLENYLLDPILVFAALLLHDHVEAKRIAQMVKYTKGNLNDLYNESAENLSYIATEILALIKEKLPAQSNETPIKSSYINNTEINFPHYLINTKGHVLFGIFVDCFGGNIITHDNLVQALAITRLIPKDIADVFLTIKNK